MVIRLVFSGDFRCSDDDIFKNRVDVNDAGIKHSDEPLNDLFNGI